MSITNSRTEGGGQREKVRHRGASYCQPYDGGLKTSERLMSATVELSMKDKNICKLRHMARGINAFQIIPCNLKELMGHSPENIIINFEFTKSSRHFIFILSLTQSIFWSSLSVRSFSHYTLQLRCATGRNSRSYSPPHPVQHTQEHTKYRDAILFTLFICVFFIFRHTLNDLVLFLLIFGTSCQDYF